MENIKSSLTLYFKDYEIKNGKQLSIDKEEKIITVPKNLGNIDEYIFLGMIFFLYEKQENEIKIENNQLDTLETKQLEKTYSYIQTFLNTQDSIVFAKKEKVKKYLNFIAGKINLIGPLWGFVRQQLFELNNYSVDEFIEQYLEFKGAYLQANCESCEDIFNDMKEDEQTYNEHDGVNLEPMNGEDMGVIGFLDPVIRKTYFVDMVLENFDVSKQKFVAVNTKKQVLDVDILEQTYSYYNISGKKGKTYILPLSKDLKVVGYNNQDVQVFQDEYGRYFVRFLKDGDCDLSIGYNQEKNNFFTEKTGEIIYKGTKIDLEQFSSWQDLKNFIKGKKYANVSQSNFHKSDVNSYIEALFESEEMDCLPANILFTSLARSLGYNTRLITGYQTYIKDEKTYVSTSQGHAWSEVFVDGYWKRVDATPVNTEENQNEEQDLDNLVENIIEEQERDNQEDSNFDNFALKDGKDDLGQTLDSLPNIESKYFKSALKYVRKDAEDIVLHIQKILEARKEHLRKQKMRGTPKKTKRGQMNGKLKITPRSIVSLSTGDPRIFEKQLKQKIKPNEDIDTRLKDVSLAIDVSGSMGSITGNWETGTKLDNAYLSVVLLYAVSKALDVNFDNIVLFSDNINVGNPEEILKKIDNIGQGGNDANTIGIETAIKSIENTRKGAVFVISDGDGETGTRFFDNESRKIILGNKKLVVVGYGIGKDAASKLEHKMKAGKVSTVIEFRMQEANIDQSKGFPVEDYQNLVPQLKKHLEQFMTANKIIL